jgi:hypothetical protein
MALIEIGSAADEAAAGAPVRRDPVVPPCRETSDHLLDAVRRGLAPGDPVARLLAGWPLTPARAVGPLARTINRADRADGIGADGAHLPPARSASPVRQ